MFAYFLVVHCCTEKRVIFKTSLSESIITWRKETIRVIRRASLVEQELLTLPEHMCSPPVFSGYRVTRFLVLCVCFADRYFFFLPIVFSVLRFTDFDYLPSVSSNSLYATLCTKKSFLRQSLEIKVPFLYFDLYLRVMLDSRSCSFILICV
jgi:hypothetical protein